MATTTVSALVVVLLLFFFFFQLVCVRSASVKSSLLGRKDGPACVAHRGASAVAPENTITAFQLAEELGAELVEVDVQMSRDSVPIIIHDPTLDRTTNCSGLVSAHDYYGDMESCWVEDVERLPVLNDLLNFLATSRMICLFDIKAGPSVIDQMAKELYAYPVDLSSQVLLAGQSQSEVDHCAEVAPDFYRSWTTSNTPDEPSLVDVVNFNVQFTELQSVGDFVERAHESSQTVFAWTLNSESTWAEAIQMNVDGVVTDYTEEFVAFRDSYYLAKSGN